MKIKLLKTLLIRRRRGEAILIGDSDIKFQTVSPTFVKAMAKLCNIAPKENALEEILEDGEYVVQVTFGKV